MSRSAAAFYLAGRAVALASLGAPVGDVAISDAPRIELGRARRELIAWAKSAPPKSTPDVVERELLPTLAGATAMLRSGAKDRKLQNAVALEANKVAGVTCVQTADDAKAIFQPIDERARQLVNWRWHSIERIARGLMKNFVLTAEEITALMA